MTFHNGNASYSLAKTIMNQLVRSGVKRIVISPGFRNSPLILAAKHTPELDAITCIDERSAVFFALGASRADGRPVAAFCTSGTATGNYLPAIMEACHAHIPLIAITADRPEELLGTGANQTTSQAGLYSNHARESFEISAPVPGVDFVSRGAYVVGRAVAASLSPRPGPVHINVRFREPFLPESSALEEINQGCEPQKFTFLPSSSGPSLEQSEALRKMFSAAERTIFAVGPGLSPTRMAKIFHLASQFGFPVLAEPASGFAYLRERRGCTVIQRTESLLLAFSKDALEHPDLCVRFGAPLLTKEFGNFIKKSKLPQIIFDEYQEAREPDGNPAIFVQGGMEGWLEMMPRWDGVKKPRTDWVCELEKLDAQIEKKLEEHIASLSELTEWGFHRALAEYFSPRAFLFLGNSMPIRDFNSVFPRTDKELEILSNRGQSGIDGLVSSAAGLAVASGAETHAILGDLSTLHDISAFAVLDRIRERASLTIWVLNNGGGEIFRIVPTAEAGKEEWFTTPENVDFSSIAKAFRIPYLRIAQLEELRALERTAVNGPGVRVVEVLIDPARNKQARRRSF